MFQPLNCGHRSDGEPLSRPKARKLAPWEVLKSQPTMIGVAYQGPPEGFTDTNMARAYEEAEQDLEEKYRKGEHSVTSYTPLFIADISTPPPNERSAWDEL